MENNVYNNNNNALAALQLPFKKNRLVFTIVCAALLALIAGICIYWLVSISGSLKAYKDDYYYYDYYTGFEMFQHYYAWIISEAIAILASILGIVVLFLKKYDILPYAMFGVALCAFIQFIAEFTYIAGGYGFNFFAPMYLLQTALFALAGILVLMKNDQPALSLVVLILAAVTFLLSIFVHIFIASYPFPTFLCDPAMAIAPALVALAFGGNKDAIPESIPAAPAYGYNPAIAPAQPVAPGQPVAPSPAPAPAPVQAAPAQAAAAPELTEDAVKFIKEYKKLYDEGILSKEQYERKRKELLGL